jgi:hypothetical protein
MAEKGFGSLSSLLRADSAEYYLATHGITESDDMSEPINIAVQRACQQATVALVIGRIPFEGVITQLLSAEVQSVMDDYKTEASGFGRMLYRITGSHYDQSMVLNEMFRGIETIHKTFWIDAAGIIGGDSYKSVVTEKAWRLCDAHRTAIVRIPTDAIRDQLDINTLIAERAKELCSLFREISES